MGCDCNKISNTCGEKLYAACTYYEGALPVFTTLAEAECYTLEEIIADIYLIETSIKEEIDLTELTTNGITYELVDSKILVKKALKAHADLILELQSVVEGLTNGDDEIFSITDWGLDFECIADSCANPPTELKDLLQLMITEICSLKTRVTALETP
jgi:hypothetical protein